MDSNWEKKVVRKEYEKYYFLKTVDAFTSRCKCVTVLKSLAVWTSKCLVLSDNRNHWVC